MNTNLITSYVVGGLVLISFLVMNANLSQSSNSLTMRQLTQNNSTSTKEIFYHDLLKIGYQPLKSTEDPISVAADDQITFQSDLDNDGSLETVEWFLDQESPLNSTENPHDYALARSINGARYDINLGITELRFTYLDEHRDTLATPVTQKADRNRIRYINIKVRTSSGASAGDEQQGYTHTVWDKTFSPVNLN